MAELKTVKNAGSVDAFLAKVAAPQRDDATTVLRLMKKVTGEEATMWGSSIVGFGSYHYRYASGREGDWMVTGFSPRAKGLTLYLIAGFGAMQPLLARLGRHETAKSCLYIPRLADVDLAVLEKIVRQSVKETRALDCAKTAPDAAATSKVRAKTSKAAATSKVTAKASKAAATSKVRTKAGSKARRA